MNLWSQKFPNLIEADSTYIETNPGKLTLGLYFSSQAISLLVTPQEGSTYVDSLARSASYSPNLRGGYGLAFSYRLIDFSLGLRQALDSTTEALLGRTDYGTFRLGLWATRKFRTEITYEYVKGFANTAAPTYQEEEFHGAFPHRSDLRLRYIKLRGIYQFNPEKFSYRAAFANSERQLRNAGGFMINSSIYAHRVRSDSSLIPWAIQSQFGAYKNVKNMSIGGFGLAPGVGGTWTGGKWYLTGLLFLGGDLQHFSYRLEDQDREVREFKFSPSLDIRIAYGYNNKRFFVGAQHWLDYNILNPSSFNLTSLFSRNLLTFGYRFDAPRVLDNTYNWGVQHLVPKRLRQYMY